MMKLKSGLVLAFIILCVSAVAQQVPSNLVSDLQQMVETPTIPGYEQELAHKISAALSAYKPSTDNLGDIIVTVGSGAPHRLIVAPMDEPGYVVSGITQQGYLRLQRLPQGGALLRFNELYSAQPVEIQTLRGTWINGIVAGVSVHLTPRQHPPDPNDIDEMYVDIGAKNAAEVHAAGADILSPVALDRHFYQMGFGKWAAPAIGDRFGDAALLEVLRHVDRSKLKGTLTVAFAAQQWSGARGLTRLLESVHPDELIYVGRLNRLTAKPGEALPQWSMPAPGTGVLIGAANQAGDNPLLNELKQIAASNHISLTTNPTAPLVARGYATPPPLPARVVHLAVPIAWPSTPAEFIDAHDLVNLISLLENYLQGTAVATEIPTAERLKSTALPNRPVHSPSPEAVLKGLIETYGVSEHETPVRETIERLLPSWAKPETDSAGNLVLHWGNPNAKSRVLVVAHMDELGFVVREIRPDGRLDLDNKGGGVPAYFQGHAALVHTTAGIRPGILEFPEGWDQPKFDWPRDIRSGARMDVGARTPEQVAQLGISVGDYITVPKTYRHLLHGRVSGRSMDDRVGCAALVAAAWALGPQLANRNVTFVWSAGEELGLLGAADLAKRLAAQNRAPDFVFAVDTFVSADSPVELQRFGDAKIGDGFVARAVDNSNVTPRNYVARLISTAQADHIPAQYGVTGGGNDGSAFLRYGSVDVAIGWPLRYSHSPAEVIDTHDLDSLTRMVAAVARSW